jgi:hypothetical protein
VHTLTNLTSSKIKPSIYEDQPTLTGYRSLASQWRQGDDKSNFKIDMICFRQVMQFHTKYHINYKTELEMQLPCYSWEPQ